MGLGAGVSEAGHSLSALRQQIAELAVAQAEGLNALMEYANSASRYGHSAAEVAERQRDLRGRILAASARSLAVAEALVENDER
ncbi:MAG: hypothetical protein EBX37_00570 [Alphaproteobacteria bacterium]|jgi:hypothetical protein|nr:hypothetical protein [Alphaproteobacteria bacterium]